MTRDVTVILNGSTRQGEAIAIIVRFIEDGWVIPQRLIRIDVFSKSVNANELTRVLNEDLCVEVEIGPNSLLAAMRDRVGVNQATLNRIQCIFPNFLKVVCFSYTLDNRGSHLMTLTLQEFANLRIRLFHSYRAKLVWKDLTGWNQNPTAKLAGVEMGSVQAATGAVWGRSKISSGGHSRENLPKHCAETTKFNIRFWVPCQPQAGACCDH